MKIIYQTFLLLLFLFSKYSFAQIPYASQQPKWSFPIYAKDALGQKDTIYIGYDPNAMNGNGGAAYNDINFGEKWFFPSQSAFFLGTYYWISALDSVLKVNIQSAANSNPFNYLVHLTNVKMPVTFKWDLTKLHSDSLPFPSQNPLPNAQIYVTFPSGNWWIGNPGTSCNISIPVVVSDTINTNQCNCYAKDSLQILDPANNSSPISFYFQMQLVPWTGNTPTGIKTDSKESEFIIFTDLSDNLNIIAPKNKYKITLSDLFGNILLEETSEGSEIIKTSNYHQGVYIVGLSIIGNQTTERKKIIIK